MSIKELNLDTLEKSGTGVLNATIANGYIISKFEGKPTLFITDGEVVILRAFYQQNATTGFSITLLFAYSIKEGRYEFHAGNQPKPPKFQFIDSSNDKIYDSDINAGHIEVKEFDTSNGTFKASFNFTFNDPETGRNHQTVGDINFAELEHIGK